MVTAKGVAAAAVGYAYLDAKHYLSEDNKKLRALLNVKFSLAAGNRKDENSLYYTFENTVKRLGDAECYRCEGVSWSWNQTMTESRRIAHYLLSLGIKKGDTVALYMSNRPAYPIIWLACLSIDVVPAFINYNLTGQGLLHCIRVAEARAVLYESTLAQNIAEIQSDLLKSQPDTSFISYKDEHTPMSEKTDGLVQNERILDQNQRNQMSTERLADQYRKGITWQDPACLIYTSGTTGLPKAANVTHGRSKTAFIMWTRLNEFSKKSRIYTPMPLYHSTAALLAIGVAWYSGATVVIGRKFSATKFWSDVRESDANVIQYVGEVLRYLLAVPPSPLDKQHNVKIAYGNGCRPDVWNRFRDRFGVQIISEFFASTEGNGSLFNYNANSHGAGAVGHFGSLASITRRKQQAVVRVDPLTEEPARDAKGFCIRADRNESGEMLMAIDPTSPFLAFAGYKGNKEGTEKKILRDVFAKGDMWFRTGDLLRIDNDGFWYFGDRLGDTFRWKSENVATTQLAEVLGAVVDEANVYGVQVPGHEGRAGCAAIPVTSKLDLDLIAIHVAKNLPKYAQPLFLRIVPSMESTGTVKQLKVALRNQGVDPATVKDPVYWLKDGKYVPFKTEDWQKLQKGMIKL